jgi:hypothetical protein
MELSYRLARATVRSIDNVFHKFKQVIAPARLRRVSWSDWLIGIIL